MVSMLAARRRVLFVAMLLLGVLGLASPAGAVPAVDVSGNTYTSPLFGYTVTWNDTWFVTSETSEGFDEVELTNGLTYAWFFGQECCSGNAVLGLARYLGNMRTDPSISNYQVISDSSGNAIRGEAPDRAYQAYSFTVTFDDGSTADLAEYSEYRTVKDGISVVGFHAYTGMRFWDSEFPNIQELLAGLVIPGKEGVASEPEVAAPVAGEPGPAFVSGQWRVAVASASLNDGFDDLRLKPKAGKEWLVVLADVTNWSSRDGVFAAREFTVRAGPDGEPVNAAPNSTKSVAKSLKLEPATDELTVEIAAGATVRVALVYAVPARSRELTLAHEQEGLPLADALSIVLDPDALPERAVPPEVSEGEFVSASDGETLRVQIDGEAKSTRMRLIGVDPPAEGACYEKEAEKMLDDLAGERVIVEDDAAVTGGSTPGRYVWLVNADGTRTLINEHLIANGLAKTENLPVDARFGAWMRESEQLAEAGAVGLWLDCVTPAVTATKPAGIATATTEATRTTGATPESALKTTHDVVMQDIKYDVTEIVVPANSTITINLTNEGAATHTFNIDELDVHSGEYKPGQTGSVTFETGRPGTYSFYCSIPGHEQAGMIGTLKVVAAVP